MTLTLPALSYRAATSRGLSYRRGAAIPVSDTADAAAQVGAGVGLSAVYAVVVLGGLYLLTRRRRSRT